MHCANCTSWELDGMTFQLPARTVRTVHALARRAELPRPQPQRQPRSGVCPAWHQSELAALPGNLANLRSAGSAALPGRRVMSGTVSRGRVAGPQAEAL